MPFTSRNAGSKPVLLGQVINAQNTQIAAVDGVDTPGSAIVIDTRESAGMTIQSVSNTLNAALSILSSIDGLNWTTLSGAFLLRQSNISLGSSISTGTNDQWTMNVADFAFVKISTPNSAITGSVTLSVFTSPDIPFLDIYQVGSAAVVPGTAASNLGKAEDAAHASGDTGVFLLGVRQAATPVAVTSAAQDYSQITVDAEGKLILANQGDSALTWQAVANPTTAATNVALKAAAAAGIRNYVTDLTFNNGSAAAAEFIVQDGATTIFRITVPATSSIHKMWQTPLRGTAATAMNVQIVTTATGCYVSGSGYTGI